MTGGSSTDRTLPANDRIVIPVLHECLGLCPRTLFPQLPDPNHKGVFTAHELNWTDLQLVDPVTRGGVHWSRASASRLDWAAAKLGRLVLSRFLRCECVCSELQFGNCRSFQFVCGERNEPILLQLFSMLCASCLELTTENCSQYWLCCSFEV